MVRNAYSARTREKRSYTSKVGDNPYVQYVADDTLDDGIWFRFPELKYIPDVGRVSVKSSNGAYIVTPLRNCGTGTAGQANVVKCRVYVVSGHAHAAPAFAGSALGTHTHALTGATCTFAGGAMATHQHDITTVGAAGGGAAMTEPAVAGPLETAGAGQTNTNAVDAASAGTPAGTNTVGGTADAITAGTPAGTVAAIAAVTTVATLTELAAGQDISAITFYAEAEGYA